MSNRVEELESKVAELQAAVNGLTEELVETKERVRLLEEEVEVDLAAGSRPVGYDTPEPTSESPSEAGSKTADEPEAAEGSEATEPEAASEVDPNDPLSESPAQAESRRETSAQGADDADFIDADADEQLPSEVDSQGDETKADESEGDDEAATEDDDIIVA
ncbi:DUF7518 family protein [Halobellus rarus]|uniref:Chromosome segregation protein SMC n=1 Tax=Halobellus rarus TaxID=1126237 RepID=A0ABD6CKF1_9EURY|nr:hypothetical protein [Halobellus rarus]